MDPVTKTTLEDLIREVNTNWRVKSEEYVDILLKAQHILPANQQIQDRICFEEGQQQGMCRVIEALFDIVTGSTKPTT